MRHSTRQCRQGEQHTHCHGLQVYEFSITGATARTCHLCTLPCTSRQCRLATFYSRSRKGRWCKGETSGHFIHVEGVYVDCDRDSIIYLSDPIGPSCHTGARWVGRHRSHAGQFSSARTAHAGGQDAAVPPTNKALTTASPCSVGCCPGVQHLLCSSVLCLLCNFMFIAHCSTPLHSAPCASATACRTCWFSEAYVGEAADNGHVHQHGAHDSPAHVPRTTLLNLERTIQQRREAMLAKTGALGWLLPCLSSHPFHQGTAAQGLVKGA